MTVDSLAALLGRFAFRYSSEEQLHQRIASVLEAADWKFDREVRADDANRFDFLVAGGVVIEVKVDGSASAALRQVERYAALPSVNGILLASTESWAGLRLRNEVRRAGWHGKPLGMVRIRRQAL